MRKDRIAGAILGTLLVLLGAPAGGRAEAPLTLVDQDGRTFAVASLVGKPLIMTFVAAHCTDACPLINAQFARAAMLLRERHINARLLTITLDPEHDSTRDMARIARTFGASRPQWIVAGGTRRNVHAMMDRFGVVAERGAKGYADVHTTYIYLLDRHGVLRKTVLASTDLSDQILSEVSAAWNVLSV